MTDWDNILEPWRKLICIKVPGRQLRVPENNLILRCFQYAEPERVPYGDFCWHAECRHYRCVLKRDGEAKEILCCQTVAHDGDEIIELSSELARCLSTVELAK